MALGPVVFEGIGWWVYDDDDDDDDDGGDDDCGYLLRVFI